MTACIQGLAFICRAPVFILGITEFLKSQLSGNYSFTMNYLSNRSRLTFDKTGNCYTAILLYFASLLTPSVPPPEACVKKKTITPLCFVLVVCGGCWWCLQTFLVRKCSSSQRKVLCLRATADKSASSVKECFICEEDSSEYKTSQISMRYPPATTAMYTTVRRSPLQVQCSSYACRVKWCGTETVGPLTDLQLPYFLLNVCLTASHSCQSNSVCSITSIRLGQLSTQLP